MVIVRMHFIGWIDGWGTFTRIVFTYECIIGHATQADRYVHVTQ